jgi:ribonuclease HI
VNYLVYTDGSASVKDRTGGYAYKIVDEFGVEKVGGGSEVDTTISRMELMAAIAALEVLSDPDVLATHVLVISDSEYVVKGFNDKARARNKNVDLWLWLEELAEGMVVWFQHTKGHADDADNNEVDKLAGEFRQAAVRSLNAEC